MSRRTGGGSLTARLVVSAGLWSVLVLSLVGFVLTGLFRDAMERNFDDRLTAELDNLIATAETDPRREVVLTRGLGDPRYDRAYSGWYWQIRSPSGAMVRSRSLWDGELPVEPDQQIVGGLGPNGDPVRMLTRTVVLPGNEAEFHFAVAGATAEMRRAAARFNRAVIISLGVMGAGLLITLLVQVRYGLSPLREIQRGLAAIRAGTTPRLDGAFPREIQPLVVELNALIEQNARVIERARTQVGNLAHGLKTPLSVLSNTAEDLQERNRTNVERQIANMREQIDRYLARARVAGPVGLQRGHTPVANVIHNLTRTLKKIYRDRELEVRIHAPPAITFAGDTQDLQEVLGNVLDNAFKFGNALIEVSVTALDATHLRIDVADDGPGVPPERRASLLERGQRLDETVPGSGLGLDIAHDIITLYGGQLTFHDSPHHGLLTQITLPSPTGNC